MRMRNTFMASTAALLASLVIASAQNTPREERGSQDRPSATQNQRGSGAAQKEQRQQPGARGEEQQRAQGQRGERDRPQTTGQGQREQSQQGQRDESKQGQKDQTRQGQREQTKQGQRDQTRQGQNEERRGSQKERSKRDTTVGQGSREDRNTQKNQDRQQQGQQRRDQQQDRQQQGQQQRQDQQQQGQREQGQASGRVTLSVEQQTRVRETVFAGNAPRVDRVNFSVRVGTVIPTAVRIVEVPSVLIEIHPEWRGHMYFVTGDEIVICDNSRRIVAMVPVGSSSAGGPSRGSSGGVIADLTVDEIREVQMVLVREGFSIEVDGRFGPRMREALIQFQRRNGLQATGQIDSRTIVSLGVNIRGGGAGDSTTGQGRGSGNQPPAGNNPPSGNNPPAGNNPPSGNNPPAGNNPRGDGPNRGGANNQPGGNNPSGTTGQGGMPRDPNANNPDTNATPRNNPGSNMPNPGNRQNNPNDVR